MFLSGVTRRGFDPGRNETTSKIAIGSIMGTFFANAR